MTFENLFLRNNNTLSDCVVAADKFGDNRILHWIPDMSLRALPLLLACFPAIAGDISQCGFIRDSDLQSYCRGTAGNDQSQCGFIRDSDLQSLCKAEAGGGQSQCGFIRDSDKRALCMAKAKP